MKRLTDFLIEVRPSTEPLKPTPDASANERELARVDTSQKRALERLARQKNTTRRDLEHQLRTSGVGVDANLGDRNKEAARFQYATGKSGSGRSDELKADLGQEKRDVKARTGQKLGDIEVSDEREQEIVRDKSDELIANMPLRQRMKLGSRNIGPLGGLTGDETRNAAFQDAVMRGAGADAPEPEAISTGGEKPPTTTIARHPGFRHLFQGRLMQDPMPDIPHPDEVGGNSYTDEESGLNYTHNGNKWLQNFEADDALTLAAATRNRSGATKFTKDKDGNTITQVEPVSRGIGDTPGTLRPSVEELKNISEPMIQQALENGDISDQEAEESYELLDAFKEGEEDAEKAQNIAFDRYVGEIGKDHEAIQEYLDATGSSASAWNDRGLNSQREKAAYGGNLGPKAEKYRVPGTPEGVYDWSKLKKDKDKNLIKLARMNRGREVIRTYLQQGGKNAYARWEGVRSINEMPLEHILDLAGGGFDHPKNWVFASQELNNMKSDKGGFGGAASYVDDQYTSAASGVGFRGMLSRMAAANVEGGRGAPTRRQTYMDNLEQQFRQNVPELFMSPTEYAQLNNDQKQAAQQKAIELGLSPEEAETQLPLSQLVRTGAMSDPEGYEKERLELENMSTELDTALRDIQDAQGLPYLKSSDPRKAANALNTVAGREAQRKIAQMHNPQPQDDGSENDDFGD